VLSRLHFSDYDNWKDIEKQYIFEAWVPFVSDRPLQFFVPREGCEKEGFLTDIIDDNTPSSQHQIVSDLKRRKVVVLTSDELSKSLTFPDVLVAKIITVKEHHRQQDWYRLLLRDEHPLAVYLPKSITGEECYINMAQITTIGKKLLIEKQQLLPADRMEIVEQRYEEIADLGVIKLDSEIAINE